MPYFTTDYAINIYEKLENELGFGLGVRSISVRTSWSGSGFFLRSKHISISSTTEDRWEFKFHLYHEILHSLIRNRYRIPEKFFKPFKKKHELPVSRSLAKVLRDEDAIGPSGYVSYYATLNYEEDMAETWAAYLMNGRRTSGRLRYMSQSKDIRNDKVLRKKLKTIRELIAHIQRQVTD
jgi:hypothetical protein